MMENSMIHVIALFVSCLMMNEYVLATSVVCPNISALWWPDNPYIYRVDGKITGLLSSLFTAAGKYCCKNKLNIEWSQYSYNYTTALKLVVAPLPNNDNNNSIKMWLPFSLLYLPETSGKKSKGILQISHLVIFTSEEATEKLAYVYNGLKGIFPLILITLFLTILFGIFLWVAEVNSNESEFPKPFIKGAWHGFWWAIVTITTVGYGDKHPRTGPGKFIGILWMILGLILFPCLTAELTSLLTSSVYSLTMKHVGVLRNTKAVEKLSDAGAIVTECNSYEHCLEMLASKKIEAVATDPHVARHLLGSHTSLEVKSIITATTTVDVIFRDPNEKLNGFFDCIKRNTSLTTRSIMADTGKKTVLQTSDGSLLSNAGSQTVGIIIGCVAFVYFCVLIGDTYIRWRKKHQKIGDFRSGVFMEKGIIKNSFSLETSDAQKQKQNIRELIEVQKRQLLSIQATLDEIERQISP